MVSPACDPAKLRELCEKEFVGGDMARSLTLAPGCPEDFYREVRAQSGFFCGTYEFLANSPWAADYLSEGRQPWHRVKAALMQNSDSGKELYVLSLPAIPFDKISQAQVCEVIGKKSPFCTAGLIAGACRSRKFAEELHPAEFSGAMEFALLFSPHTSGRKLEKLAKDYPILAGLARCHPNGGDIPLSAVPSAQWAIVCAMKNTSMLPGRGAAKTVDGGGGGGLVI